MATTSVEFDPASMWCQRWDRGRHSFVHRSAGGFDPAVYTVEPIPTATARDYVQTHHYSGSYVADRFRFGLFHHDLEGTALVGVAVLGVPTSPKVLTNVLPGLVPYVESVELSRLVLESSPRAPANAESWFVARCFTELAAAGVRGVVSFADPVPRTVGSRVLFAGHAGTVYQALGGVYTGRATARTITLLPDGTVLNSRAAQKVRRQEQGHAYVEQRLVALGASVPRAGCSDFAGWLAAALDKVGARRLRHGGNLRYVFPVGPDRRTRTRVRIVGGGLPYPKLRQLHTAVGVQAGP